MHTYFSKRNRAHERMSENPNYEEAVTALKFDPDAGDKEAHGLKVLGFMRCLAGLGLIG